MNVRDRNYIVILGKGLVVVKVCENTLVISIIDLQLVFPREDLNEVCCVLFVTFRSVEGTEELGVGFIVNDHLFVQSQVFYIRKRTSW